MGVVDRHTLIVRPMKDQQGRVHFTSLPPRIQRPPGHAGPVSPERPEAFDDPLSGETSLVEVVSPDLPHIRWCADGDQGLDRGSVGDGQHPRGPSHGVPNHYQGPARKALRSQVDGGHDIVPEVPGGDEGSSPTLPMMPNVENQGRKAPPQEGSSEAGHGPVIGPPSMDKDQDRTISVLLRPDDPTGQLLIS